MNLYSDHSDEALLSLIRQNDEPAFAELYDRYAAKVRSIAFAKLQSRELASEIVQDIFCSLWERRTSCEIASVQNYLMVAVKYQVINHIRRELSHRKHNHLYQSFVRISGEETLLSVEYHDLAGALEEGVQRLPEKTQQVFRLNRFEGRSISEIAVLMNLSEKAIKYHITRSLRELRLYLKDFLLLLTIASTMI